MLSLRLGCSPAGNSSAPFSGKRPGHPMVCWLSQRPSASHHTHQQLLRDELHIQLPWPLLGPPAGQGDGGQEAGSWQDAASAPSPALTGSPLGSRRRATAATSWTDCWAQAWAFGERKRGDIRRGEAPQSAKTHWSSGRPGPPRTHLLPLHDPAPRQELVVDDLNWARDPAGTHRLREQTSGANAWECPRDASGEPQSCPEDPGPRLQAVWPQPQSWPCPSAAHRPSMAPQCPRTSLRCSTWGTKLTGSAPKTQTTLFVAQTGTLLINNWQGVNQDSYPPEPSSRIAALPISLRPISKPCCV